MADRLRQAQRTLHIADLYFGKDPRDWDMLQAVGVPVQVLTKDGDPPPAIVGPTVQTLWVRLPKLPFTHFAPRVSGDPSSSEDFETLKAAPKDLYAGHAVVLACQETAE